MEATPAEQFLGESSGSDQYSERRNRRHIIHRVDWSWSHVSCMGQVYAPEPHASAPVYPLFASCVPDVVIS
jgi:hypothetical protein